MMIFNCGRNWNFFLFTLFVIERVSRNGQRYFSLCEHRQHCKFGFHLAVPIGKRSSENKSSSSSTSTPHVIALVRTKTNFIIDRKDENLILILIFFQVGLPARGKTYISKKLSRYLNWIGINTKVKPIPIELTLMFVTKISPNHFHRCSILETTDAKWRPTTLTIQCSIPIMNTGYSWENR